MRIIKLNTSEGISPLYLLLGGLGSFSNLTNVAILQAPYLSCCTSVVIKSNFHIYQDKYLIFLFTLIDYLQFNLDDRTVFDQFTWIHPNVCSMAHVSYYVNRKNKII